MFNKILLPTDGSSGVEKAIECAATIAGRFGAKVYVLHVVEPIVTMVTYDQEEGPQEQV